MKELYEQIKKRLDNYEDGSFIVPYDQEIDGYRFGDDEDEYFESSDMVIFRGIGWYCTEEVSVKKVYTDDNGNLLFDLNYEAWNADGDFNKGKKMTEVRPRLLDGRCCDNGEQGEELEKEVLENIIRIMDYYKDHLEEYDDIISEMDDEEEEDDWDDDND